MLKTLNGADFHHVIKTDENGLDQATIPLKELSDEQLEKHIKDILHAVERGTSVTVHALTQSYRRTVPRKIALELLGYKHYIAERNRRRDERVDKNMKAIMKVMNL